MPTNDNAPLSITPGLIVETRLGPEPDALLRTQYNHDRRLVREIAYENGQRHCRDGPALRCYDPATGNLHIQCYYVHGALHRQDGPAVIHTDPVTGITTFEAYYRDGRLHRTDGPALIHRHPATGAVTAETYAFRNQQMSHAHWQRIVGMPPRAPAQP